MAGNINLTFFYILREDVYIRFLSNLYENEVF